MTRDHIEQQYVFCHAYHSFLWIKLRTQICWLGLSWPELEIDTLAGALKTLNAKICKLARRAKGTRWRTMSLLKKKVKFDEGDPKDNEEDADDDEDDDAVEDETGEQENEEDTQIKEQVKNTEEEQVTKEEEQASLEAASSAERTADACTAEGLKTLPVHTRAPGSPCASQVSLLPDAQVEASPYFEPPEEYYHTCCGAYTDLDLDDIDIPCTQPRMPLQKTVPQLSEMVVDDMTGETGQASSQTAGLCSLLACVRKCFASAWPCEPQEARLVCSTVRSCFPDLGLSRLAT